MTIGAAALSRSSVATLLVATLAAPTRLSGQAAPPQAEGFPLVRLTYVDGHSREARLQTIRPSGEVTLGPASPSAGESRDTVQLGELTRIRRLDPLGTVASPIDTGGRVWSRSGFVLGFDDAQPGSSDAGIRFTSTALSLDSTAAQVELAIEHLTAVRFLPARSSRDDAGFAKALADTAAPRDFVFAFDASGKTLKRYSLLVAGLDARGLLVDAGGRVRPLPLNRVYGVVFGANNGRRPDVEPSGNNPVVRVSGPFAEGGMTGHLRGWDGVLCRFELAEGPLLTLPCASIAEVQIDNGRLRYLSNYAPTDVQQTAALDRVPPWLCNRTRFGEGLLLDDTEYGVGLCLRPRTALSWELEGELAGFDVFEATVGIDDRSNAYAHAVLRVVTDDNTVFEAEGVTKDTAAQTVSIPLDGVRRLTLEVDFGDNLDFGDHCVFAEARLRKS